MGEYALGGYKINRVLFNKLSDVHIPYYIGMILIGPKGCKYLVDEFNTDQMFKQSANVAMAPDRISNIMMTIGRHTGTLEYVCIENFNDNVFLNIAREYNLKPIQRLPGYKLGVASKVGSIEEFSTYC